MKLAAVPIAMLALASAAPAEGAAWPDSVLAQLATGNQPRSVCCSPSGERLYVAVGYGYLAVFDVGTWELSAFVPMGDDPTDACILPSGDSVYVTDGSEAVVRVLDTATNTLAGEIAVPYDAERVLATPDGQTVAVMHEGGHVSLLDVAGGALAGTVWAGSRPSGMCCAPDGGIYVSDRNSAYASLLDPDDQSVDRFFAGGDSWDVLVLPGRERLYLCLRDWDMLQAITVPSHEPDGEVYPAGEALHRSCALPGGRYAFYTDATLDAVVVVDAMNDAVVDTVPVGGDPDGLCASPSGDMVFVTGRGSNDLTVLGMSSSAAQESQAGPGPSLRPSRNPAAGSVSLLVSAGGAAGASLSVHDLSGRTVHVAVIACTGPEPITVPLPPLPAGTYVCRLVAGGRTDACTLVLLAP